MPSRPHEIVRTGRWLLLVALVATGCQDASSDPLSVILPDGAAAGFVEGVNLPSLSSMAGDAQLSADLEEPLNLWTRSWDRPLLEGRDLRLEAYEEASGRLAEVMGSSEVDRGLAQVEAALEAAEGLDPDALGPRILDQLDRVKGSLDAARTAQESGDEARALLHALVASDLLREVGPESVVRVLIRQAEARRAILEADPGGVTAEDLARGDRLIRGARVALASGEYARAAQRAFYACQILGVQPR